MLDAAVSYKYTAGKWIAAQLDTKSGACVYTDLVVPGRRLWRHRSRLRMLHRE